MMKQTKKLILLLGATGQTGFHIAQKLLSQGHPVRVLIRSRQKLAQLFKERQISFQKIVQGNITDKNKLQQAFKPSEHFGDVKIVISALGCLYQERSKTRQLQYISQVNIVDLCKKTNVQKYIVISSLLITKPWHPFIIFLNTIMNDLCDWKLKAQNYIRQSGISYIIIRPGGLRGNQSNKKTTGFILGQGDKLGGMIDRATVGQIVYQSMINSQIPNKTTFECVQNKKITLKDSFKQFQKIKIDDQKSNVKKNHKIPRRICNLIFLMMFLGVGLYFGSCFLAPKQNIQL